MLHPPLNRTIQANLQDFSCPRSLILLNSVTRNLLVLNIFQIVGRGSAFGLKHHCRSLIHVMHFLVDSPNYVLQMLTFPRYSMRKARNIDIVKPITPASITLRFIFGFIAVLSISPTSLVLFAIRVSMIN